MVVEGHTENEKMFMGDIIGRGTSDKKSQKSDQKTRKDSSSIRKCEAPPDQTSTRSNHKTRKDISHSIGNMFHKTLEILNSTPTTDCRCPSEECEQQIGNMCMPLKFFSDEYASKHGTAYGVGNCSLYVEHSGIRQMCRAHIS